MKRSYLCIGGPYAGRKYDVLHGNRFKAPMPLKIKTTDMVKSNFDATTKIESVESVTYKIENFRTPECDVQFWVPEGQTAFETMKLLLEGYERTAVAEAEIERLRKIISMYEIERLNNLGGIGSPS